MAWTHETFAGLRGTGQPSAWRVAMFELCRAVNERQAAHGFTKTLWVAADETETADISMDELYLLRITGITNRFELNCTRIMAAIKTMTPFFSESSGISNAWTVSSLQTAVGLGTFIDTPARAQQALFFQQCKDALDLLIYGRRSLGLNLGAFDFTTRDFYTGGNSTSAQTAWEQVLADTPDTFGGQSTSLHYEMQFGGLGSGDPVYFSGEINTNLDSARIFLDSLSGTITACQYSVNWSIPSYAHKGGTMNVLIGSTEFSKTLTGAGPQSVTETYTGVHGDLTISETNNILVTEDLPATYPLETLTVDPSRAALYCTPLALILYFDIAHLLEDQS
jgi:hypothetical protein